MSWSWTVHIKFNVRHFLVATTEKVVTIGIKKTFESADKKTQFANAIICTTSGNQ